jgi:Flp pilus assembly protein TadD
VLLGTAYLGKGDLAKANEIFRRLVTLAPKDPRGSYLMGVGLRAQGKLTEAKKEFEAALALAPAYLEPLEQLISMALVEKQPDAALARVTKQTTLAPKSGGLQWLLGTVYLARRELAPAEGAFLKAIELEPTLVDAYVRLGQLYGTSRQYDQALAKVNEALRVDPQSVRAEMLLGLIYESKGDIPKAQQAYEKILTLNPRFAPAANNLAWLYSERGGDKEKALELAQRAKEAAPDDPHVSDTLGWILYKRGVHQRAAALLRESATKLPDQPVIQYHLGLASLKVGDKDGARKALTAAVGSPANFAGKDEARKALAEIR